MSDKKKKGGWFGLGKDKEAPKENPPQAENAVPSSAGPTPATTEAEPGASTQTNPDAVVNELTAGNQRFIQGKPSSLDQLATLKRLSPGTATTPKAAILCSADARVDPNIIFDVPLGDLFVCRTFGTVMSAEVIGGLEYAADRLRVPLVVILGNNFCPAVTGVVQGHAVPGNLHTVTRHVTPALDTSIAANPQLKRKDLQSVVERTNIENALGELLAASPRIAGLFVDGKVALRAAMFHVETGEVSWL